MFNRIRNVYAHDMLMELLKSTHSLLIMSALVIVAGCLTFIFMRGIYKRKLLHLPGVIIWLIITQCLQMVVMEAAGQVATLYGYAWSLESLTFAQLLFVRIGSWVVVGLCVTLIPFVHREIQLSLRGRIMFLVGVHIMMRILLFASLGGLFLYGLHYPKLLSKVTRVAPACRDAVATVLQDL